MNTTISGSDDPSGLISKAESFIAAIFARTDALYMRCIVLPITGSFGLIRIVRDTARAAGYVRYMTLQWLASICGNLILYALMWRYRPSRMRMLWISQTLVIGATLVNLCGWYMLSDAVYDRNWGVLHIAQLFMEILVAAELVRLGEVVALVALLLKLNADLQSYWAWDSVLYQEGLALQHICRWLNVIVIALLCRVVYIRRSAPAPGDSHMTTTLEGLIAIGYDEYTAAEIIETYGDPANSGAQTNAAPGGDDDGSGTKGGGGH